MSETRLSRRQLLGAGAALGLGMALGSAPRRLIDRALAASGGTGGACDIEHIVILIQENRSFDHYFGAMSGVTGFNDANVLTETAPDGSTRPIWYQYGYNPDTGVADPNGWMLPFHLDTTDPSIDGWCTNDIDHSWGPQHGYWDGGKMDHFVSGHVAVDGKNGPLAMGYYTRSDLGFYYALADAFTVCDHYHCSVLGPTDPNRLYSMSGMIDPAGQYGGPLVETLTSTRPEYFGKFTWKTMPEVLRDAGVSWKVYQSPDGQLDDVLPYFKAYQTDPNLAADAFGPTFPGTFQADCQAGNLPAVSWVLAPVAQSEHPAAPPTYGEYAVYQVLEALLSNPDVWAKTAFIVTYDENGGFFDHVPPPTAPANTAGEYLSASPLPAAASGVAGPIGLGFRVPCLVVSPFSRGGNVCSQTFDHTSLLKFIAAVHVDKIPDLQQALVTGGQPNISAWRWSTVGDLTAAFNSSPRADVPSSVTAAAPSLTDPTVLQECAVNGVTGTGDQAPVYPYPTESQQQGAFPPKDPTPVSRGTPSGLATQYC
ncbi:MAG TPA: alkaline phosphatase family protein [Acidimicrobiales bacterium]|nr:alkaline phosphatase family protein [Acidimicrobiales bacterium]